MDYGRAGLAQTLDAAAASGLPVIGAGRTEQEAFAPYRTTVGGLDVAVVAATDVLDSFALESWPARPDRPGLADSKDPARLLEAVTRQVELARLVSRAGADVVVGSHAHVVQPSATVGSSAVHYGMGNFIWYSRSGPGAATGVLTVTLDAQGVTQAQWHPARIVQARPLLLEGRDEVAARAQLTVEEERCRT